MRRCSARRVKRLRVRGMRSQRPIFRRCFDPVSSRKNFTTVKDPSYFKQQVEEMYATEVNGFAEDIESEIRKLESCDLMIWQFPLWWFGLPAALKGWVDRVFALGRTYGGGRYYETGIFRGKRALLSLTTGGQEDAYRKGGLNADTAPDSPRHLAVRRVRRLSATDRLCADSLDGRTAQTSPGNLFTAPGRYRPGIAH
jgi:putative NADPH-quinone reductase